MIMLQNDRGFAWYREAGVSVKGYVHAADGRYMCKAELCRYFSSVVDYAGFGELLKRSIGCFAVVWERDEEIWAATDKIRSFPLFYSIDDDAIGIADLAPSLKAKLGDIQVEQRAIDEFLMTAYVTGRDTLYAEIKQIQAGESLCWNKPQHTIQIDSYFRYSHKEPKCIIQENLIEQLDSVHQAVFERLIKSLDGRTAVIPLSGGLDSRLVAVWLKQLNYPHVICFSYGGSGNSDSTVSKAVAEYLGFPWIFIEHTRQKWYDSYQSKERREFYPYAANLCSMPHIQDWEAVRILRDRGLIPEDSVFIPGHSGDFLEGSHLPYHWQGQSVLCDRDLYAAIFHRHYNNWPWKRTAPQYAAQFRKDIRKTIDFAPTMSVVDAVSSFEEWDWKERQAKFIINSVRVYEYFEYEWRLPLWDADLMEFWSQVPTELRFGRKLYHSYVSAKQDIGILPALHVPRLHVRAWNKAIRLSVGNILDIRYGRFGDIHSWRTYLSQTIDQYRSPKVCYPAYIPPAQRVLVTDIIALLSMISVQEIL